MTGLVRRDRRALWLGALVVVPIIAWRAIVAPLATSMAANEARAAASAELFAREQALGRDAAQLRHAVTVAQRTLAAESPRLFIAADSGSAASALIAWARGAAISAGLRDMRGEAAPVTPLPGALIGVQVDVRARGNLAAVTAWLSTMERDARLVTVHRLELTGAEDGALLVSARIRALSREALR
ncbi:MAG: hypothetical protein NTW72_13025 [Gemmatimonadetes bacterium]|nr:hypothetical protein [Gemmatimonadota bacterium]